MFQWSLNGFGSTPNLREVANNSVARRTFIAWIPPQTFLDLAYRLDVTNIHANSFKFLTVKFVNNDIVAIPQLSIASIGYDWKVIEHEGRHRCVIAIKHGVKKVPVAITLPDNKLSVELIERLSNSLILSQDRKYEFLKFTEFWIDGSLYYNRGIEWKDIEVSIEDCLAETSKKHGCVVKNPAKNLTDLPSGYHIRIMHYAARSKIVYFDICRPDGMPVAHNNERCSEPVFGQMEICFNNSGFSSEYTVRHSYAANGFGPLLYDIAMEYATKLGYPLCSDRRSLTTEAKNIWAGYGKRRDLVRCEAPMLASYVYQESTNDQLNGLRYSYKKLPELINDKRVQIVSDIPEQIVKNPLMDKTKFQLYTVSGWEDEDEEENYPGWGDDFHKIFKSGKIRILSTEQPWLIAREISTEKMVGACVIEIEFDDEEESIVTFSVAIHPDYRRCGIARDMIIYLIRKFPKCTIKADVINPNMALIVESLGMSKNDTGYHVLERNPPTQGFSSSSIGSQVKAYIYKPDQRVEIVQIGSDRKLFDISREAMILAHSIAPDRLKKYLPELTYKSYSETPKKFEIIYSMPFYNDADSDDMVAVSRDVSLKRGIYYEVWQVIVHAVGIIERQIAAVRPASRGIFVNDLASFNLSDVNGVIVLRDPIQFKVSYEAAREYFERKYITQSINDNSVYSVIPRYLRSITINTR